MSTITTDATQITDSKARYSAGVLKYRQMGYWQPDYIPKDTDTICLFRITPQEGVDPVEAGAAVAGESSTATWTVVWTDRLTACENYRAKCYKVEQVPNNPEQYFAWVAYDIILFEEGSIANITASLIGNVFSFKPLKAARLEDIRVPVALVKTFKGPPTGLIVERERLDKFGRPLLGATTKPKLGLSGRNYGRVIYEGLKGGLDFMKDDENINSQPFQRWQNRFEFVAEAIKLSEQETGERKGHYLNVTANTPEEMYERAEFAKELNMPIIMHDFITGGFTANTGLSKWCRKNGMLLHIHRAMHAVIDRHPKHGIHFRVLAKCLRLSGGDQLHTGTVVGKLEGDRQTTLGYIDQLRESFVPEDRSRGNFFDQDWGSMSGVFAVASGGIHVWHMPALVTIFGDDSVLQFGGGTHGHPWGSAAGAAANRVALEACVKARNAGRHLEKESRDILMEAAKHSPELAIALETWKEIKFEFDTVDKLDVQN